MTIFIECLEKYQFYTEYILPFVFFLYLIHFEQYNLQTADQTYQQLPLQKKGAGNVYRLVLSSWKVNIAENLHCKYL